MVHESKMTEKEKATILSRLVSKGVYPKDIEFRVGLSNGNSFDYIRYRYWRQLDAKAYDEIKDEFVEDYSEDNDGDDAKGRPITIHKFSYTLKTK